MTEPRSRTRNGHAPDDSKVLKLPSNPALEEGDGDDVDVSVPLPIRIGLREQLFNERCQRLEVARVNINLKRGLIKQMPDLKESLQPQIDALVKEADGYHREAVMLKREVEALRKEEKATLSVRVERDD